MPGLRGWGARAAAIAVAAWLAGGADAGAAEALVPGRSLQGEIARERTRWFEIRLAARQRLAARVSSQGIGLAVALRDPDWAYPLRADVRPGRPEPLAWVASQDGVYALELEGRGQEGATGAYRLEVEPLRFASELERKLAEAQAAHLEGLRLVREPEGAGRARALQERALAVARETGERRLQARVLRALGAAFHHGVPIREAVAYLQQALALVPEDDAHERGLVLLGLGRAYWAAGDHQESVGSLEQALALFRSVGSPYDEGVTLEVLASVLPPAHKDSRKVLDHYRRVLELVGTADEPALESRLLLTMAGLLASQGDDRGALAYAEKALSRSQAAGNPKGEAKCLSLIGFIRTRRDRSSDGLAFLHQAHDINVAVGDHCCEAIMLANLAAGYQILGRAAEAVEIHDQTLALARRFERRDIEWRAHGGRARALLDLGRREEALAAVEEGLAALESSHSRMERQDLQLSHWAAAQQPYDRFVDLLLDLHAGTPGRRLDVRALDVSERARARTLLQTVAEDTPSPAAAVPLTAAQMQALLDESTVLLNYDLHGTHSHLWVVSAKTVEAHLLPAGSQIEALARRFQERLTARNRLDASAGATALLSQLQKAEEEAGDLGAKLSAAVLGPLKPRPEWRRLVVVPDGALQGVPFAALPLPRGWGPSAQRLVQRYEVVNAPSASVVAALGDSGARAGPGLAVFADPVFDREDPRVRGGRPRAGEPGPSGGNTMDSSRLARLGYTRVLAEELLRGPRAGPRLKALDFGASRERALSPDLAEYGTLVFASHGLLDNERPERSGIVLSMVDEEGRPRDGVLRLQDIYALELAAELVVLAACETALGEEMKGEGFIALSRGFMHAGARRVLGSLWKVEESATMELIERFLRVVDEGQPYPAALRRAQAELAAQPRWASPYFWAGFVLQGDWR